jgi:hypothetical protein
LSAKAVWGERGYIGEIAKWKAAPWEGEELFRRKSGGTED